MNFYSINFIALTKLFAWIALGFLIGFGYRHTIQHYAKNSQKTSVHNINRAGRTQRALISLVLFTGALFLNCNPIILIACGFTLFEAFSSWCIVNSILGKNSCDI